MVKRAPNIAIPPCGPALTCMSTRSLFFPPLNRALPVTGYAGSGLYTVCLDIEDLFRLNFRKRFLDRSVRCAKALGHGKADMGLRTGAKRSS